MGGGASQANSSFEELLQATYMVGRAIAAMANPGMYRIYDFHSTRAPRLKNANKQFSFYAEESDDDEDDAEESKDSSNYAHFFNVKVGEDTIYIENPVAPNQAGWTPLHACCMSMITVPAGLAIIDEFVRRGESLDLMTLTGPGTFNHGWSALQMACAYGVEALAEKLIKEGANVNCSNCFGYTPLLEACHRGFINIVSMLIRAGADLFYIPPDELAMKSPFVSSPPQSVLGEACRCGYPRIAQALLEAGADKEQTNSLRWTPLHEACFYNRVEVVKLLLLRGASASARTKLGALPYHLATLPSIRGMLEEMGGPDAIPDSTGGDSVDMMRVLRELSYSDSSDGVIVISGPDGHVEVLSGGGSDACSPDASRSISYNPLSLQSPASPSLVKSQSDAKPRRIGSGESKYEDDKVAEPLLHSGGVLGDLPTLAPVRSSPPNKKAGGLSESPLDYALDGLAHRSLPTGKKKKKKIAGAAPPPKDTPVEFLCALSQRLMSEPVKTVYSHLFDKPVISKWFAEQGKICPLTGAPLSDIDLTPQPELAERITKWLLERSTGHSRDRGDDASAVSSSSPSRAKEAVPSDDIYDF